MAKHAERFTGRVAEYEKYRLRYPVAVVELLRERCGLRDEDAIADVGAGTGMLAELFLENGNAVTAIEPNAEMRAACERLRERYPKLAVIRAAAESTTLPDESVRFVLAGRAFHWFDRERALAEFRRVLKPDGWVVLMSSGRWHDGTVPSKQYEEILREYGTDDREPQRRNRIYDELPGLFERGAVVKQTLKGEQRLTLEEFLGQTQSFSSTPLPEHPKYEPMQAALRTFFARYEESGLLRMGSACSVMACQV
jgi:SAM-dependent methyltransferase